MGSRMSINDPPEYDDVVRDSKTLDFLNFRHRIQAVQAQKVNTLVSSHVEPFLEYLAQNGMASAILIIVPSDVPELQIKIPGVDSEMYDKAPHNNHDEDQAEAILGFPDGVYLRVVRLRNDHDRSAFWTSAPIAEQVQARIRERLGLVGNSNTAQETMIKQTMSPSFWKRKSKASFPRGPVEAPQPLKVHQATTNVSVKTEEVSVRASLPMDLCEIRNGFALVIRIESTL